MKHRIVILFLFCLSVTLLLGQSGMSVQFIPSEINVNILNTTTFDPEDPGSQPILSQLVITNLTDEAYIFEMQVNVFWNSLPLLTANFRSDFPIEAMSQYYTLTNRDLITDNSSNYFSEIGNNNISLQDILESNSVLEAALLSGYFPDGVIRFQVLTKKQNEPNWTGEGAFNIRVRNSGSIFLATPGRLIGQNPPVISNNPLSYIWNSTSTGFNTYNLLIKEFPPNLLPTLQNINTSGNVFYNSPITESGSFSDYLPYQDDHYYAWRISTDTYNQTNSQAPSGSVNSSWYVFRFNSDANQDVVMEISAILNMLNNPLLRNLFASGFTPTGSVVADGRVYTGQQALDLINSLIGKEITVEINQ